jgi:hypothetical protein
MQTTITDAPEIGLEGQIADASPRALDTATTTDAETPAGVFVLRGAAARTCALPAAAFTEADVLGVVHRDQAREPGSVAEGEEIAAVRFGRVYVRVEDAVTAGGDVFARHTPNGPLVQLGAARSDADGGNAATTGARFLSSAGAGELAIVGLLRP